MEKETKKSLLREARSLPHKHLEVILAADHLYLQKFQSDQEATDVLLTMAHMVREKTYMLFMIRNKVANSVFTCSDLLLSVIDYRNPRSRSFLFINW